MRWMKNIVLGIVLCHAPLLPCRAALPPISLEELAARLKEGGKALKSMRVTIEATHHRRSDDTPPGELGELRRKEFLEYRMRDQFGMEHCKRFWVKASEADGPEGPVLPTTPQGVFAYDGRIYTKRTPMGGTIAHKPIFSVWELVALRRLTESAENRSHWEDLRERKGWEVAFLATAKHDGRECYVVRSTPEAGTWSPKRPKRTLWICPGFGFRIVRQLDLRPDSPKWYTPSTDDTYHDFDEYALGVWLPRRHEYRTRPHRYTTLDTYIYRGINVPIRPTEFVVHFPSEITVTDNRVDKGLPTKPKVLLGLSLPVIALVAALAALWHRRRPRSG